MISIVAVTRSQKERLEPDRIIKVLRSPSRSRSGIAKRIKQYHDGETIAAALRRMKIILSDVKYDTERGFIALGERLK